VRLQVWTRADLPIATSMGNAAGRAHIIEVVAEASSATEARDQTAAGSRKLYLQVKVVGKAAGGCVAASHAAVYSGDPAGAARTAVLGSPFAADFVDVTMNL
jgi:hypothetical protein